MSKRSDYVREYYKSYATGEVDEEIKTVGSFLIKNVTGPTLDCGCGPVPQLWAIFMPHMTELYAIDLPQESIDFVKEKIAAPVEWIASFSPYQKVVEAVIGAQAKDYILQQVSKIKGVRQSDMTLPLPFPDNFFDTALSLYSLGCLKNEDELDRAIINIKRVLKTGGKLLHINTNGENPNTTLPAYTWNGLGQTPSVIECALRRSGFKDIEPKTIPLSTDIYGKYRYNSLSWLLATKA